MVNLSLLANPPPLRMCTPPSASGQATSNVAKHTTAYATSFPRRVSRAGWVEVEPGEGHGSHRELAASPDLPTGVTAVAPEGGDRTGLLSVPRSIAPATPWLPLSTDGKGRQPQGAKGRTGCYPKQQRWAVAPDGGGGGGA